MSFTSGTSGTSSAPQGTLGDVPPITFPGIASGIDYNAIIQKYTAATQQAEVPYQDQINNLNAANAEILKIQNLLQAVQDSLTAISNVTTFQAYTGTPSVPGVATVTQIKNTNAIPGTYTIQSQVAATATQIVNDSAANATLTPAAESGTAISSIGASVTPNNGVLPNGTPALNGTVTINGVQVSWNTSEDLQTILNGINGAGAKANAVFNPATGTVTLGATTTSGLAVGSASDLGNLVQFLHLDTAQDVTPAAGTLVGAVASGNNTITVSSSANYAVGESLILDQGQPTQETVQIASIAGNVITLTANTTQNHANASAVTPLEYATSSSPIVGINRYATLSAPGNAGFATQVSSGTYTINGVTLTINNANQSVNDIINQINQSAAGVTATFNSITDHIELTSNTPGNTNISLGSATDTSNFLGVSGLSNATGLNPTTTVGTQASITYSGPTGAPTTIFSSTGDFSGTVIPGMDLKVLSTTTTPYTVTVANNPQTAEKAIGAFVTAYNSAIQELNTATQPPQIASSINKNTGQKQAQQATQGGLLYKNFEVVNLRNTLVQTVSGLLNSGSSSYNSLQSIGLQLDTASVTAGTTDVSDSTNKSDDALKNLVSTSGRLNPLDTTTFEAALSANPTAVQQLFTNTAGGLAESLGTQLSIATGFPTFLAHGLAGSVPSHSLLNTVEDSNQLQIDALQLQVNLINDEAVMQANELRAQFSASETQIAQLQALQGQIASIGH
jgi:flagellar hook-associated protein 2